MTETEDLSDPITFSDLGLNAKILQSIEEAGYVHPTPIQEQAIPHVLTGGDITGIAQTGTGKTAAFVLPVIHRLAKGRARARMPRTLILAPTRELADQVAESFIKYGKHLKLTMALLIGGVSFKDQERLLMQGVDVLIATPGRLKDQFERGKILLTGVETLIIDEADRMLDMGFIDDIEQIVSLLPKRRQTLLFSATFAKEIEKLARNFQRDPLRIEVTRPAETAATITQYVVKIPVNDAKARRYALRKIIESCKIESAIVFCNRKREVDIVTKSLSAHGFDAAAIHGDLSQTYRMQTLERFRKGELKLLIGSDVAARGLDIPDVSHVFNFAPPPKDEDYVHRIGRTGRAGRAGKSYTIVGPEDEKSWTQVLKMIGQEVEAVDIPGLLDELSQLPAGRSGDQRKTRARRGEKADPSRPEKSSASRKPSTEKTSQVPSPQDTDKTPEPRKPSPRKREAAPAKTRDLPPSKDRVKGFGDDVPSFFTQS